jgi:D-alanyl-D-alanine carboxypeptidase
MNFASGTSQQYSHTDNGVLGQRGTKQSMKALYDKNIYGPVGMKDMRFPVDQDIQGPVLHAVTTDRKVYEDCTYWNSFWALRRGCPRPTSMTWANGPRSSEPDV